MLHCDGTTFISIGVTGCFVFIGKEKTMAASVSLVRFEQAERFLW